jgi:4-hydroxy-3-methylbut-2-enyl diphosphate reductase
MPPVVGDKSSSRSVRYRKEGYHILIRHREHEEVIGTIGEAPEHIRLVSTAEEVDALDVSNPTKHLTQTT